MPFDPLTAPLAEFPPRGNCFDRTCITRTVLGHVTGRWGSLVVAALRLEAVLRFSELRARIDGISEKMLAQTLRDLERDGLLLRTSRPVVPPHVEYRLTPLGAGVAAHVEALLSWIETHVRDLAGAQRAHDARSDTASARGELRDGVRKSP
jgi:DNA-binding HxlR family transcriptional regulator